MNRGITHFGRQTAIYMAGNVIYRGASFLLVPLYVHMMPAAEYGKLELLTITTFIVQSVFSSGFAHAAMRYYFEYEDERDKKRVVSTALLSSFAFSSLGSALVILCASWLSRLVYGGPGYEFAFRVSAVTMTLEMSREIGLSVVRAREKPGLFIGAAIIQLLTQVATGYYTVVVLRMGMEGVLIANLTSALAIWIVLSAMLVAHCGLQFDPKLLRPLAIYGMPLALNGLSITAFGVVDRYLLNAYANLTELGQYSLALRIATAVTALAVDPFKTSYGPFRLVILNQPNANDLYARILRYYMVAISCVVVGLAAVSRQIVQIVSSPEYWPAGAIIPLLLCSPLLSGVDYCFQTGILIKKSTIQMFYASFIKGGFRVLLMCVLIPFYGIQGAAWSGVLGGVFGVSITYWIAQRLYPIPLDYLRLSKITVAGVSIAVIAIALPIDSVWIGLAVKGIIGLSLPFVLLLWGCITGAEVRQVLGPVLVNRGFGSWLRRSNGGSSTVFPYGVEEYARRKLAAWVRNI